jgi:DNA-binding transcriptional LysR family regulator
VFRRVAVERSFTRAATQLGVSQSALSQTVKRLEAELGLRLLDRSTRSVAPTAAGDRLLAVLEPALAGVEAELAALADLRDRPSGTIRVTAGRHAADVVLAPALARLLKEHPDIQVEACVDDGYVDIVAQRFDAGIRLGERLETDMIATPVGPAAAHDGGGFACIHGHSRSAEPAGGSSRAPLHHLPSWRRRRPPVGVRETRPARSR